MVMGTEKRNIELNEFEPIDNINNPYSFQRTSHKQKFFLHVNYYSIAYE